MKISNLYIILFLLICLVLSLFYYKGLVENFKMKEYNMENKNLLIKTNEKDKDQLDILKYSNFKPECCPSAYTNSSGCLCFDYNEDIAIISRGNNRNLTCNDSYVRNLRKKIVEKNKKFIDSLKNQKNCCN